MIEILKHNFKNRSNGFNIAPAVLAALVQGGTAICGNVLSGIGGAKAGEQDREDKFKTFNIQLGEDRIDRSINKQQTDRSQNQSGIGMLAEMRGQASKNSRHQVFKDALYKLGGA